MRHHDVSTKQWNLLHAVNTGRHAAEMAEMGFTGSSEIIEGPQGWSDLSFYLPQYVYISLIKELAYVSETKIPRKA